MKARFAVVDHCLFKRPNTKLYLERQDNMLRLYLKPLPSGKLGR